MDPTVDWKLLYIEWITEKRDRAASKGDDQTFMERNYNRVLKTLETAEIGPEHPSKLKKLPGIGEKTCNILVERAKKHCEENGLSLDWTNVDSGMRLRNSAKASDAVPKRSFNYVPRYGTVPYHVLCGMRQLEKLGPHEGGFGKDAIGRFLKTRMMNNDTASYSKVMPSLTAAFTTLSKQGLVSCRARRYFLEPEARTMADKFLGAEKQAHREQGIPVSDDADPSIELEPSPMPESLPAGDTPGYHSHTWTPDQYTIKLAIDTREVSSLENRDGFREALRERGLEPLVIALPVGDCCWMAEHKVTGKRAVLDHIVERKCTSDLIISIMDGRFQEQKARLQRSRISNLIYLVEITGAGDAEYLQKHKQRIHTAMSQTLVHNGFHLRQTSSQSETVLYLYQMTQLLVQQMQDKPLAVIAPNVELYDASMSKALAESDQATAIDYDSFYEATTKSRKKTVGEVFAQMLMAIRGISAEKALAIQEIWKTPRLLVEAYAALPEHERGAMVMEATRNNVTRRKIRLDLSMAVAGAWGTGDLAAVLQGGDI